MRRRTKPQAELKPAYVRPTLSSRERDACRAWRAVAYSGQRARLKTGQIDPLQMRVGMRANLIQQRAGWVVSNPLYDQTLRRVPALDPSLSGVGWLREVYRWDHYDLVVLPGVRSVIEARLAVRRAAEAPAITPWAAVSVATEPQMEMFA